MANMYLGYLYDERPTMFAITEPDDPIERRYFRCRDCFHDTLELGEYYMVHRGLWLRAWGRPMHWLSNPVGILCFACLARRIGRPLRPNDFPHDIPINSQVLKQRRYSKVSNRTFQPDHEHRIERKS